MGCSSERGSPAASPARSRARQPARGSPGCARTTAARRRGWRPPGRPATASALTARYRAAISRRDRRAAARGRRAPGRRCAPRCGGPPARVAPARSGVRRRARSMAPSEVGAVPGAEGVDAAAQQRGRRRRLGGDDRGGAGRSLQRGQPERLVSAGQDGAARGGKARGELIAVAHVGVEVTRAPRPSWRARSRSASPIGPVPSSTSGQARRTRRRPRAAGAGPSPATGARRRGRGLSGGSQAEGERRLDAQAQAQRRRALHVDLGVDDRHDRVDLEVGAAIPAPQRASVDGVRAGQAGGVQRRRGVVHGDDRGAALVGRPAGPARGPERIVEQDHVRRQLVQRGLELGAAERDPVAVGRRHAQRAVLVAPLASEAVALPGMTRWCSKRPVRAA